MNRLEAAAPPLSFWPPFRIAGRGSCRLRGRLSRLKGRYAIAARRPPAALDPRASAAPDRRHHRQATACRTRCAAPVRRSENTKTHLAKSPRFQGIDIERAAERVTNRTRGSHALTPNDIRHLANTFERPTGDEGLQFETVAGDFSLRRLGSANKLRADDRRPLGRGQRTLPCDPVGGGRHLPWR